MKTASHFTSEVSSCYPASDFHLFLISVQYSTSGRLLPSVSTTAHKTYKIYKKMCFPNLFLLIFYLSVSLFFYNPCLHCLLPCRLHCLTLFLSVCASFFPSLFLLMSGDVFQSHWAHGQNVTLEPCIDVPCIDCVLAEKNWHVFKKRHKGQNVSTEHLIHKQHR